jgi:hypothetical protein
LNIVLTFPTLRRIDVQSAQEELIDLNQEFTTSGTLYGIPITPHTKGYDEAKAKEAKSKLRSLLTEYRTHLCEYWLIPDNVNEPHQELYLLLNTKSKHWMSHTVTTLRL